VRVLAVDTATADCSVAACHGPRVLAQRRERLGTGHAERIVPLLAEVMAEAQWCFADIELIAATLGPGTFTGIRAGVAAARALALATGRPAVGVSSLEALAASVRPGRAVTCVVAGRRGSVFAQRFGADGAPLTEARVLPADAIGGLRRPGDLLLVGGGASLDAAIEAVVDGGVVARAAMARLARGEPPGPGWALRPLYLRDAGARAEAGRPLVSAA
jgi:tRNA threonylcarbamoyl adenosine modification protein YeaZ